MTLRAVLIGIFLGLLVPIAQLSNDIVRQKIYLLGSQLPLVIFGTVVILLLVWNPLLGRIWKKWVLRPAEIAVITGLGLAVCAWPGSNFMRTFATSLALPSHLLKSNLGWQTSRVMSYLPGGSPLLAEGFIRDWQELTSDLTQASKSPAPTPALRVWQLLSSDAQNLLLSSGNSKTYGSSEKTKILNAINAEIARKDFYDPAFFSAVPLSAEMQTLLNHRASGSISDRDTQILNRLLFDRAFASVILPMPRAKGDLVANGQPDPVAVDLLIQGSSKPLGLTELPWRTWWPTLELWGSFALVISIAALCLALIVHPQWSKRELLPYPIARFVNEITESSPRGGWPLVAYSKLFWLGFGLIFVIHVTNGLNSWFPQIVKIPLQLDFDALRQLFPSTVKIDGSISIFKPILFPTVIAFSFFLSTEISFSLGIAGFLTLIIGGILISQGIPLNAEGLSPGKFSLLTFGGYLAFTAMLLYVGRRYYWNVVASTLGVRRHEETPSYATWAARGLIACCGIAVALLLRAGLDWSLCILALGLILIVFFVLSRIYAETGVLMAQCGWAPLSMLLTMLGPESLGPTSTIVIGLACVVVLTDSRETWMAYLINALQITDNTGNTPARKMAPLFLFMLVAGFAITVAAGFLVQYNKGVNPVDRWAIEWVPVGTFNTASAVVSDLTAKDQLGPATAVHGLDRFRAAASLPNTGWWIAAGALLVGGCYFARLRLPWWPIHPILFLLWGTWASSVLSVSFLIGWIIKYSVVNFAGAKAYHAVKPLMVGIIAGEIVSALVWGAIGAAYYLNTGLVPLSPTIFP